MKRSALERAVARATGESRRTIRRYGFQLVPDEMPTEVASHLGLDCPSCGAGVALAETTSALPEFAECLRCDTVFPFEPGELYLAESPEPAIAACA